MGKKRDPGRHVEALKVQRIKVVLPIQFNPNTGGNLSNSPNMHRTKVKKKLFWDVWGTNPTNDDVTLEQWPKLQKWTDVEEQLMDVNWLQANPLGHSQLSRAMGPSRHLDKVFLWALLTSKLERA